MDNIIPHLVRDSSNIIIGTLSQTINWTTLFFCLFAFVYLYFREKFSYWRRIGLKNPTPIPWFGTTLLHIFWPKPELELKLHQKLGKLYGLYDGYLGTNPTLVCGHPEAIKQVTIKHFDSFTNRRRPATWKSIRYRALTYMRDDEWKNMRKTLAPIFTSSKLKRMFDLMKKCAKNMQDSIVYQGNGEIDLKKLFSVYTVDVISTCCFSMDLKSFRHSESELLVSARKFFNVSRFKMAFYAAIPKQLLALFGFDINDTDSIGFFAKFATEIIHQRRKLNNTSTSNNNNINNNNNNIKDRPTSKKQQDDFLQILIDAVERSRLIKEEKEGRGISQTLQQETEERNQRQQDVACVVATEDKMTSERAEKFHDEKKIKQVDNNNQQQPEQSNQQAMSINKEQQHEFTEQELGDMEILAQTMLFFAVGHETTATLLSSCGYFLALYPELQDRLYQEVHQAFEEDKGDISYDKLLELNYLDAFVSEALRYFTPTLVFDREASEDVDIEIDNFKMTIPKGMGVVIPFHAIHHDPDNYEDPERFDPERFMPENKHKIKPCTFIPFGSGPRYCLASRFALIEAKLALATLVNRFKFVKSQGTTWPPKYRHHYMLLQMVWPRIRFVDRKLENTSSLTPAQMAA